MSSSPPAADRIFAEALLRPAGPERAAYLIEACGDDAPLRQRVERLLRAHEDAASFLETPPSAIVREANPTIDQAPLEKPGTQIGPYKLLQQIGEGGMGVVYMAEQTEPVQRKVALKVIKPGMDSRQVIARFEAERQALAMMDHVNIARVLDAGATESGRPFFVMELVHGVPITKYCDDNRLTPRQRLELFVPVCQAIQHAHQKGIIHRDIKPSNVMVTLYDGKPVPKVIDFGVAKATEQKLTERTLFTQYGTMVGTLEYMSPEQAEMSALGVDTRSDIYSLGVLLYELLTGSTPLSSKRMKEAAYAEILRLIKEEEPAKPSTRLSDSGEALASISAQRHMEPAKLTKLVRGELDWIVMKTLEKDRNRRYETASGFAADIERYLNDETVQACPPGAGYRFRKFARRNRTALMTASLVAAALIVGTVVSAWQAVRATRAEGLAKTEGAVAQAVNDFLNNDLLAQADPRNEPDREIKLRTVVDRAAATIEVRFGDQPLVEATVRTTVGRTYDCLGERKKAEEQLRRALEIRRRVLGTEHPSTAKSSDDLGAALQNSGHLVEAEAIHKEAFRVLVRARGTNHPDTLDCLARLAMAISGQGRHTEAEKLFREVYEVRKRVSGPEHSDTLKCLNLLAINTKRQGKNEEAEKLFREVLEIRKRVLRLEHPQSLNSMFQVADAVLCQGRSTDAEKLFREILEAQRRVMGPEHSRTLNCLDGLRRAVSAQARHAETQQICHELYEIRKRSLGPEHPATLVSMNHVAQAMERQGLHPELEQHWRDASNLFSKLAHDDANVPDHFDLLADTLTRLGEVQTIQKRFEEAEQTFRQVGSALEKLGSDFPTAARRRESLGSAQQSLGESLWNAREKESAEKAFRQSVLIREKLVSDFPEDREHRASLGQSCRSLAMSLDQATKTTERERLWRHAAAQFKATLTGSIASAEQQRYTSLLHGYSLFQDA